MTLISKEKVETTNNFTFAIRKISSEDDVGSTPRSQHTPKIVSVYAESIRRQRSDSFVHSYHHQKTNLNINSNSSTSNVIYQKKKLPTHRPVHVDMTSSHSLDPSDSGEDGETGQQDSVVYLSINNTDIRNKSSRLRSDSLNTSNTGSTLSTLPSLHINTGNTTNKNDTGAILEGVLIRRAIRPGSHLVQQQVKEDMSTTSPKDQSVTSTSSPSSVISATSTSKTTTANTNTNTSNTATLTASPTTVSPSVLADSISLTPWQPPSLNNTSKNPNIAFSSADDDKSTVVSKLLPRKEKSTDDQNKHPSLFKRLAYLHHHAPKMYRDDHHFHDNMLQSPSSNTTIGQDTELDRYGFQKATQWITLQTYHEFEKFYQPILDRRSLRWEHLLDEQESKLPDRCAQVKRYIRKGIPSHLRGRVWFHYSSAEAKMDTNPGVYDKFLKRAQGMGDENEFADLIERDLHRTFPDNVQFSKAAAEALSAAATTIKTTTTTSSTIADTDGSAAKPPAIDVLRRVLSAFSVYCPSVGYCQSLNYLVGMLLLFLKEEETFWCLVTITQTILPAGVYDVTMEGASIDQAVLMMLLYERMPQLWYKMTDKTFWEAEADGVSMPTITLVTSHWFLTLFINILPTETVLRVWDCFFFEGSSILFRIALTLFKMVEPIVYGLDDPLEIFQVVQNFPKRLIDCQTLLDNAFRKYGSLTDVNNEDLDRRREICRDLRKARRIMGPEELVASRHKGDSTFRKRWKIQVNPSASTAQHHHYNGSRK